MTRQKPDFYIRDYLIFHEYGTTSLRPDAPAEVAEAYARIHSHNDRELY